MQVFDSDEDQNCKGISKPRNTITNHTIHIVIQLLNKLNKMHIWELGEANL